MFYYCSLISGKLNKEDVSKRERIIKSNGSQFAKILDDNLKNYCDMISN